MANACSFTDVLKRSAQLQ